MPGRLHEPHVDARTGQGRGRGGAGRASAEHEHLGTFARAHDPVSLTLLHAASAW
jgi:hypothetical protein